MATAKRGRARTEKIARRENILVSEVCELRKTMNSELLMNRGEYDTGFILKRNE